jgi:hypothetical protein
VDDRNLQAEVDSNFNWEEEEEEEDSEDSPVYQKSVHSEEDKVREKTSAMFYDFKDKYFVKPDNKTLHDFENFKEYEAKLP